MEQRQFKQQQQQQQQKTKKEWKMFMLPPTPKKVQNIILFQKLPKRNEKMLSVWQRQSEQDFMH